MGGREPLAWLEVNARFSDRVDLGGRGDDVPRIGVFDQE